MEHKRTWIYCRVAYPDAHALASQQAALEAFAEKQGFEIAGTTAEQAGSGNSIRETPINTTQSIPTRPSLNVKPLKKCRL